MGSIWRETVQKPQFDKLDRNKKAAVLIIGGGIAGLWRA